MKLCKAFVGAGVVVVGFLPFFASAETISLGSFLDLLQKQVEALQQQVDALQEQQGKEITEIHLFSKSLWRGMSGGEVINLQKFLSLLPDVYPESLATGYFGSLTETAVKRFQAKYNIEQIGIVGPQTRAQLNTILSALQASLSSPARQSVRENTSHVSPIESSFSDTTSSYLLRPKPVYDIGGLAERIHALINEERAKQARPPLVWDWALAHVAFLHSADQARDNEELTDPLKNCHYPLIRHEGFLFGFTLKERLENQNIPFRSAGENIGMLPASKDLVYQFIRGEEPASCSPAATFEPGEGLEEERRALYEGVLTQMLNAARQAETVTWVNRAWFTGEEVAGRIVRGWMNSPGHRKNILEPSYIFGGIGIVEVNDYFIITHNFVNR